MTILPTIEICTPAALESAVPLWYGIKSSSVPGVMEVLQAEVLQLDA